MIDALAEAKKAYSCGEIPIGAVIEKDGKIVGRGYNLTETLKDPTAHAELIAIREAAKTLGGWRLLQCNLYVTCEPCAMCAGAIVWSRMKKVFIGTMDPKGGACGSVFNILQEEKLNHYVEIETGLMETECSDLLKDFFRDLRQRGFKWDKMKNPGLTK
ncbi:tRNA-specific adenosine deaminase [Aminipila terrae]|uniref:tRNA-specific adenosine deaminase n=2 Tax=Aminipila terrae TaxID=2697030 RepID=A0A6P1MMM1_9FIRM|nr:tRNA-specific adenosine deaminase [Aminipila terrae]